MNEFVEECRGEWKRLGVPDAVASEMAAELAADLEEAEAEGTSAEELLGSGAFDPRSFAAAWAAERGVIQRPPPHRDRLLRRLRMPAAIGAFALITIVGAVLVLVASPSTPRRMIAVGPQRGAVWVVRDGAPSLPAPGDRIVTTRLSAPGAPWHVVATADDRPPLPAPGARIVAADIDDSGIDTQTVGWVLLTVGLACVVPLTIFWLWFGPGDWSGRRAHTDDGPSGRAY